MGTEIEASSYDTPDTEIDVKDPQFIELADRADKMLMQSAGLVRRQAFVIGHALCLVRDYGLWKIKGASSFNAYRADERFGFGYTMSYLFMGLHAFYVQRHKLTEEQVNEIADIDSRKLDAIRSVATAETLWDWIHSARATSRSDFQLLIQEERNKQLALAEGRTPEPVNEEPDPFAATNAELAPLHKEIIQAVVVSEQGFLIRTDGGFRVRVYGEGQTHVDIRAPKQRRLVEPETEAS